MDNTEKIYNAYFIQGMKVTEIAASVNLTQQAVSKILKKHPEYAAEKERRKAENKAKHTDWTKKYIAEQRQKTRKRQKNENPAVNPKIAEKITDDFFKYVQGIDYLGEFIETYLSRKYDMKLMDIRDILIKNKFYQAIEKAREETAIANMQAMHQIEVNQSVRRRKMSEKSFYESCIGAYHYDPDTDRMCFDESKGAKPNDLKSSYSIHINYPHNILNAKYGLADEMRTSQTEKEIIDNERT